MNKVSIGLSSLVIAAMTLGVAAPISAHGSGRDTSHKKQKQTTHKTKQKHTTKKKHKQTTVTSKQKQTATQNNQNQRNNRNYIYNITYNFFGNDHKERTTHKPKHTSPSQKQAPDTHRSSKAPSHDARFTSAHAQSKKHPREFSDRQWVYDPRLCRWVEIGFNKSAHRWELINDHDRKESRKDNPSDNRNFSYWYND